MATKKQRRRREKERRHEYEYVYIDEEGNEVPVEQPPPSPREKEARATASRNGRATAGRGSARPVRPVQPPTWRYLRKQAVIFFVIMFLILTLLGRSSRIWQAGLLALVYTLIMIPLLWFTQRMVYRSYLRRTGQLPPPPPRRPK
jgi:hypothetical protein